MDGLPPAGKVNANDVLDKIQNETKEAMKTILRTRTLRGCPFNIPFTDVEAILVQVIAVVLDSYYFIVYQPNVLSRFLD